MTGRHRSARDRPTRWALIGVLPLLGAAGLATGLAGTPPERDGAAGPPELPGTVDRVAGTASTASRALPGLGGEPLDAVAAAREATTARRAVTGAQVGAVAEDLRRRAVERAREARAAGDAELAAYREQEAERRARDREAVPDPETGSDGPCAADDLFGTGSSAGDPAGECGTGAWVAERLRDAGIGGTGAAVR